MAEHSGWELAQMAEHFGWELAQMAEHLDWELVGASTTRGIMIKVVNSESNSGWASKS